MLRVARREPVWLQTEAVAKRGQCNKGARRY
jgi:hypothetical protein